MRPVTEDSLTNAVLATLAEDAVFGVRESLAVPFTRDDSAGDAARYNLTAPFFELRYNFVLRPA